MSAPAFLITIDTEGDNLWSRPRQVTSHNARSLPRFQQLCEEYGFKPTYLCNHEMACDPFFREFGLDLLQRGTGEIGMHLHAWDSPPLAPLTVDDAYYQPYLIEYSTAVMRNKIDYMTKLLQDTFGRQPVSHRAGRWALDERYAAFLVEYGYQVDCSVTPGVSWQAHPGDPVGKGGSDYTEFPSEAYWINVTDIRRAGNTWLLELPMTILKSSLGTCCPGIYRLPLAGRLAAHFIPPADWLRPDGRNGRRMVHLVDRVAKAGLPYLQFMLHSSEFMPGGSPTFSTPQRVETLFQHLEQLFAAIKGRFVGVTLADYWQMARQQRLGL